MGIQSECSSGGHYSGKEFSEKRDFRRTLQEAPPNMGVEKIWEEIVEPYKMKSLTFASNIFPALQGLAKLVPSSMGLYLAGHWQGTLAMGLCWTISRRDMGKLRGRLTEWRAPT